MSDDLELPTTVLLEVGYTGKVDDAGWARFEMFMPLCDLCPKQAAWVHPTIGWRCYTCERPPR